MSRNYLLNDSIISPLGFGTDENLRAIRNSESAIKFHDNSRFFENGYYAGLIETELIDEKFSVLGDPSAYTKLEKLLILAINEVIKQSSLKDLTTHLKERIPQ